MTAAHLGAVGVGPVHAQATESSRPILETHTHDATVGPIEYRLFLPPSGERRALVVVLHGCLQDANDIAAGTGMDAYAERGGFAVLYPQQDPAYNPQRCWNWFDREQQRPDGPEVTRIVSLASSIAEQLGLGADRTYLVGMSAGGAMADVLAVTHPGRWTRVALHSAVGWGAAADVAEGLAAMQSGGPEVPDLDDPRLGELLQGDRPHAVLVLHGADDGVVRPVAGDRLAGAWAARFSRRAGEAVAEGTPAPTARGVRRTVWTDAEGRVVVERASIAGLGHAWSGGDPAGSYVQPSGPSSTEIILRFFGLLG